MSNHLHSMLSVDYVPKLLAGAICVALLVAVVDYVMILSVAAKMPPGPRPLPIVGNVLQFPKSKPWYKFHEWADRYKSSIITVWVGRNPIVVLNDAWAASDLMDKRANIYSSRPVYQVPGKLMKGAEWDQPMIPYNTQWRTHRKLMVRLLIRDYHGLMVAFRRRRASRTRSSRISSRRVGNITTRNVSTARGFCHGH